MEMRLDPNPVTAGTEGTLTVTGPQQPGLGLIDTHARWQCWDGEAWTATHTVLFGGDTPARNPGSTITIAGVALQLPLETTITIPAVASGTYRIADQISSAESIGLPSEFYLVVVVE